MSDKSSWVTYNEEQLQELEQLASDYIEFISCNKTERECVTWGIRCAEAAGYRNLDEAIAEGRALKPGDKIWASTHGKTLMLVQVGSDPFENGMNILGAHIDSPRLDLKQNPLYEKNGFSLLDTHYYGGIKTYQWVTLPLALHGVVAKTDGTVVPVVIGEEPEDPVFCVTDLLPHLGNEQMKKPASKAIEGESLDLLVGNRPIKTSASDMDDAGGAGDMGENASAEEAGGDEAEGCAASCDRKTSEMISQLQESGGKTDIDKDEVTDKEDEHAKESVKALTLSLLKEKYDIGEKDFLSAELEAVPAGRAREMGIDRSMVIGYGQDDRVCAYTSLVAQLSLAGEESTALQRSAVTILVDKEEIGSVGATGMDSMFFENTIAEIMELCGEGGELKLRRALCRSRMLSSDVSAGFDPSYAGVFEEKNAAYLGHGLVFNKYTGSRGKSGSNDAGAEYIARIRRVMDEAEVKYQTAELGKVDAGGGGTIAYIPARFGMDVIDSGVAVLSMHAPWEVTCKADIYEARKGYEAFLLDASDRA